MTADLGKFSGIIADIVAPTAGDFSPEHARFVLGLDFTPAQHERAAELSAKAQAGALSPAEQYALDVILFADAMLSMMQAKARASLQREQQPAA